MGCVCYWACGTRGNIIAWAIFGILFVTGIILWPIGVSRVVECSNCFDDFFDGAPYSAKCTQLRSDITIQSGCTVTARTISCNRNKFLQECSRKNQGAPLLVAGIIIFVAAFFVFCYFCCCARRPESKAQAMTAVSEQAGVVQAAPYYPSTQNGVIQAVPYNPATYNTAMAPPYNPAAPPMVQSDPTSPAYYPAVPVAAVAGYTHPVAHKV